MKHLGNESPLELYIRFWCFLIQGTVGRGGGGLKLSQRLYLSGMLGITHITVIAMDTVAHRRELTVIHYHKIMVIQPYPFWVTITQLLS